MTPPAAAPVAAVQIKPDDVVAYNNLVGAQDELVFDGDSLVFDENGDLIARGKQAFLAAALMMLFSMLSTIA